MRGAADCGSCDDPERPARVTRVSPANRQRTEFLSERCHPSPIAGCLATLRDPLHAPSKDAEPRTWFGAQDLDDPGGPSAAINREPHRYLSCL